MHREGWQPQRPASQETCRDRTNVLGRGAPAGRLQPWALATGVLASHPLGPSPNIAGLPMSLSYDFDLLGHLVPQKPSASPEPIAKPSPPDLHIVPMPPVSPAPLPAPLASPPKPSDLGLDRSRDDLLTAFGKLTLTDRYLLAGESFQDMFARVSCAFADDIAHAQRLYDAMSRLWFMPATPVLSNGGTTRGLPISCFLNSVSHFARWHRRHLERERPARIQRGRHRHLFGARSGRSAKRSKAA